MKQFVLAWYRTVSLCAVIFCLSHLPGSGRSEPFLFPNEDKLVHFLLYFLLGWVFLLEARKAFPLKSTMALCLAGFVFVTLYGFFDECHQLLVPGRSFQWLDILADVLGGSFAIFWLGRKNPKKTKDIG